MRTIKFRGKSCSDGDWFYGNLYDQDKDGRTHICGLERGCLNIDPNTVGQFTGLLDKNGNEIYEGDIIHLGDPKITYVILWIDCGLKAKQIGAYGSFCGVTYWAETMTILGNIHDNPELLKNNDKKVKEKQL